MSDLPQSTLDLFPPGFRSDPYPTYHALRESGEIQWIDGLDNWLATGHQAVTEVLRSPAFGPSFLPSRAEQGITGGPLMDMLGRWMLFLDPPDHTRLRRLVNRAFTPRTVERLRPRVQEIVDGLLDDTEERGAMDLIDDFARPLPVAVIAELLGVPEDETDVFEAWREEPDEEDDDFQAGSVLDPVIPPEAMPRLNEGAERITGYFRDLVGRRRAEPQDDLVSALVHAEGESLTEDEVVATCVLLFEAGHETTVNLIGNGTYALLRNREQLDRLLDEPSMIESGVEELLRFDAPVQLTGRIAHEDATIAGQRISAGEHVVCLLGAANRDPAVFEEPDRLDVGRAPNPHVAFGGGIHFCLGAALGRLEGEVAVGTLVSRFPDLALGVDADDVTWRPTFTLRGLEALRLTLR